MLLQVYKVRLSHIDEVMQRNHGGLLILLFIQISISMSNAVPLYWIGGDGVWSDVANWSLSSGGASCNCTPTLDDDVIISSGTGIVLSRISSGNYVVRSVTVESGATLRIGSSLNSNNPALTIEDPTVASVSIGLRVSGSVEIYDTLRIIDAPLYGAQIELSGRLEILSKGFMSVDLDDSETDTGIYNRGALHVKRSILGDGTLEIHRMSERGLINDGAFAETEIDGALNIMDLKASGSSQVGLVNRGDGLVSFGPDSKVMIDLSVSGTNSVGISNSDSHVTNEGEIIIIGTKRAGIRSQATSQIFNHGSIVIMDFEKDGIENIFPAKFTNTAFLEIMNGSSSVLSTGLRNSSQFENLNSGQVKISDLPYSGSHAIFNMDTIINDGSILISRLNFGQGIFGEGAVSHFENNNLIEIDSGMGSGILLSLQASFNNFDSILISRAIIAGVSMTDSAKFNNLGYMEVSNDIGALFNGLSVTQNAIWSCHGLSSFQMSNLSGRSGISLNGGSIFCAGSIIIEDSSFNREFLEVVNGVFEVDSGGTLDIGLP